MHTSCKVVSLAILMDILFFQIPGTKLPFDLIAADIYLLCYGMAPSVIAFILLDRKAGMVLLVIVRSEGRCLL